MFTHFIVEPYTELTADPQDSFIVIFRAMITLQIIPDSPVSFVWGVFMDFFYFICYTLVFQFTFRHLPMYPFIIRRMGNTSKLAQDLDGIAVLFMFGFGRVLPCFATGYQTFPSKGII